MYANDGYEEAQGKKVQVDLGAVLHTLRISIAQDSTWYKTYQKCEWLKGKKGSTARVLVGLMSGPKPMMSVDFEKIPPKKESSFPISLTTVSLSF